jgi:hypothetical protein
MRWILLLLLILSLLLISGFQENQKEVIIEEKIENSNPVATSGKVSLTILEPPKEEKIKAFLLAPFN